MLIYLASPYTHPDLEVENSRFEAVVRVAGVLIEKGYHIFCPIAMCHPIARMNGLNTKFEYWQEFDRKCLEACGELWVVMLDGYRESEGIKGEIAIMQRLMKPVYYLDPVSFDKLPLTHIYSYDPRS